MAYDEDLANRLRMLLADEEASTERRMFGGLAFLSHEAVCEKLLAGLRRGDPRLTMAPTHVSLHPGEAIVLADVTESSHPGIQQQTFHVRRTAKGWRVRLVL